MQSRSFIRQGERGANVIKKTERLPPAAVYAEERDAVDAESQRLSITQSTVIRIALAAAGICEPSPDITCGCATTRAASRGRCPKCGLVRE